MYKDFSLKNILCQFFKPLLQSSVRDLAQQRKYFPSLTQRRTKGSCTNSRFTHSSANVPGRLLNTYDLLSTFRATKTVQLASCLHTWNLHSSLGGAWGATGKDGGEGRAQHREPRAASPGQREAPRLDPIWQAETRARASVTGRGCEETDDDGPSQPPHVFASST